MIGLEQKQKMAQGWHKVGARWAQGVTKKQAWSLGMAAMRLSAQNAAQRWSQTSIWTILAKFQIGVGDHLLSPSGAYDLGVIL